MQIVGNADIENLSQQFCAVRREHWIVARAVLANQPVPQVEFAVKLRAGQLF